MLPVPMMNVLNGGAHADNKVDFQEFMVVPVRRAELLGVPADGRGSLPRAEAHAARARPEHGRRRRGRASRPTWLQRGGAEDARGGHRGGRATCPGEDVAIALDPATSELYRDGAYVLEHEGRTLSADELADYWADLCGRYPIVSIEDGMDEEDWDGWKALTERVGESVQLVGDDLFVTNTERLRRGIEAGVANSILIKVNQIGTLTETLQAIAMAREAGYTRRDEPPLGRDRGRDDRRPRRRDRLRADQDRRPVALGSRRQVQPAAAHRGAAGRRRRVPRPLAYSASADRQEPGARAANAVDDARQPSPPSARAGAAAPSRTRRRRASGRRARAHSGTLPRVRWDRLGRLAMLFVLVALLYLYLSAGIRMLLDLAAVAPRQRDRGGAGARTHDGSCASTKRWAGRDGRSTRLASWA